MSMNRGGCKKEMFATQMQRLWVCFMGCKPREKFSQEIAEMEEHHALWVQKMHKLKGEL